MSKTTTRRRLPGAPEPMHYWTGSDGLQIAGDSWGTPGQPLVLLLHGGGQTRHAWRGTGKALGAAGYHAVAYDARGHGDSDWSPDADYSPDAKVRDLVALTVALGDSQPILIGASMGGGTSLVAVGEGHVNARALILVDTVPSMETKGVDRIRSFMSQKPDGFESLEEVAEAISSYQPHRSRPRSLEGLAKNIRLGEDGRYHWHWDPLSRLGNRDVVSRRNRQMDSARALTLPTLLVRGANSDVVSEDGVKEFLSVCTHAQFVDVAGAGHMVAGDRNDAFGRAAMSFLDQLDAAPSRAAAG